MSTLSKQLKSHGTKTTLEPVALKTAMVHTSLDNKDRDLLYRHLMGVVSEVDLRDLIDLSDKLSKS